MSEPAGTFIRFEMREIVLMDSYITFEELTPNPKTKRWAVMSKESRHQIGIISWYGPWRRYCLNPAFGTVFEEVCLREIADFLEKQTRQHKSK